MTRHSLLASLARNTALLLLLGILVSHVLAQDAAKSWNAATPDTCDSPELLDKIFAKIRDTDASSGTSRLLRYTETIPASRVTFDMLPIPEGRFMMGSPETESDRQQNEGPQSEVQIKPFWMGKCEVTWDEYEPFMITAVDREKHGGRKDYDPDVHAIVDGVSQPTPPYTEMSFGMGQSGFPAISMTQHAANKYCQWLSAQTGHFYRLPTEAEWEYACRAGTTTPYSFPAHEIDDHAWYYDNSEDKYQKVGQKKPNAWGLHDMHGNVMEWTADRYADDYFELITKPAVDPLLSPERRYPRSVRGGSWFDDPEQLRAAYRRGSDETWKQQDPQLPKSIWYHTDAQWLGFRIVRPYDTPSRDEMDRHWNSATAARK